MKKLEFETSKGSFLVVDAVEKPNIHTGIKLSEITEEQASEIVDSDDEYGVVIYQNYQTTSMQYFDEQITAIDSLHSFLKSKGIHLFENPHKDCEDKDLKWFYNELTFYKPYIFKL